MVERKTIYNEIHYMQIETSTVCNYKCIYCPVAYYPRKPEFLPKRILQKIARELDKFPNIEQIYLNGYDEPTLNPHLASIIRLFSCSPAKITLFTNGSHLTPKLIRELEETGANIDLDIHISAINREDFKRIHQNELFDVVMENIEQLKKSKYIGKIQVYVSQQGLKNEWYNQLFKEMQSHFWGAPLKVQKWFPNDRAGILSNEYSLNIYHEQLKGCSLQNRTAEWIHINATGNVILCCQDYFESYILGNVYSQTLNEILSSTERQQFHQWTTGEVEAPHDYICRRCIHALSGDDNLLFDGRTTDPRNEY